MRVIALHRGVPEATANSRRTSDNNDADASQISQSLHNYCYTNDHKLIETIAPQHGYWEDQVLTERYNRMLELFKPPLGRPAMVLIPDATHLASSLDVLVERLIELEELKCQTRCIDPDIPDPLQNGETNLGLTGMNSSTSRIKIRESLLVSASRGSVLGRTPYGYRKSASGKFEVEEHEAQVVRSIFVRYTNANSGTAPIGLRRIANLLNTNELRTRHDKPWTPTAILNILRNRVYLGNYVRCGMRIVGNHPAIIEMNTFNHAQDILQQRRPARANAGERESFLMAGLVYCGTCGSKMAGVSRRRLWANQSGEKVQRTYRYYECPLRLDGREHHSLRSDFLHMKTLKWASKLGKRHTRAVQRVYSEDFVDNTSSGSEQLGRDFLEAVRMISQGYGGLSHLKPILAAYREALANNQNTPQAKPTTTTKELPATAIFTENGEPHGIKRALRVVLERVDVISEKSLAFQKRAFSQLAA